jgi:hypothetical protein
LLSFTELATAREIHPEQRHDAVNNLIPAISLPIRRRAVVLLTNSRKSLSSAKRMEHSFMSSIWQLHVRETSLGGCRDTYLMFTVECARVQNILQGHAAVNTKSIGN